MLTESGEELDRIVCPFDEVWRKKMLRINVRKKEAVVFD